MILEINEQNSVKKSQEDSCLLVSHVWTKKLFTKSKPNLVLDTNSLWHYMQKVVVLMLKPTTARLVDRVLNTELVGP